MRSRPRGVVSDGVVLERGEKWWNRSEPDERSGANGAGAGQRPGAGLVRRAPGCVPRFAHRAWSEWMSPYSMLRRPAAAGVPARLCG